MRRLLGLPISRNGHGSVRRNSTARWHMLEVEARLCQVAATSEVQGGTVVADRIWTIGRISCLGMCKDSGGHQALKANSYAVELSAGTERLTVEVAVTQVAARYAVDCLCGDSV